MPDVIKVEDKYYILATAARALGTSAVLKDGDTFAIFDAVGDIIGAGLGEQGLYHDGTRFLSTLELRLNADRPLLLSSRSSPDNLQFGADVTNRDFFVEGEIALAKDLVHVFRSRFLWRGAMYERVRFTNYSLGPGDVRRSTTSSTPTFLTSSRYAAPRACGAAFCCRLAPTRGPPSSPIAAWTR